MPKVKLPDGQERKFEQPLSAYDVAEQISPSLAKAALAATVDDKLVDLSYIIERDCRVTILTEKDEESLEVIRHSAAHLLAQAVKILFPTAQVTIGPVINDGFYYDFAYEKPFTPEDLECIEQKMEQLVSENYPVIRRELIRDEAVTYFKNMGEHYKAEIISSIPAGNHFPL